MAATPNYEGTKRQGAYRLTSSDGTTLTSAVLTGAATGTRVREIRVYSGPTTAPGSGVVLAVVLDDGTNTTVIDTVFISNNADYTQAVLRYDNVFLPSASHSIKFNLRTAIASGSRLDCSVFGSDF